MREPAFWHRPSSWRSRLLMPLGALYGAVAARRLQRRGIDAGIPVICVGNYHVGGAGKTPTVLALAQLLRELGETPVVLSRGYGGRLRGPVQGRSRAARRCRCRRRAADDGATVPVVVARDRVDGVALARVARRQRDPDGRRFPESGDRQGCLADRDRRDARPRQWPACFPQVRCARRWSRSLPAPTR